MSVQPGEELAVGAAADELASFAFFFECVANYPDRVSPLFIAHGAADEQIGKSQRVIFHRQEIFDFLKPLGLFEMHAVMAPIAW